MNLQQAKVLLKKINTLSDSLSQDNGPTAAIERDLMLSYIRQLYEAYLDTSENGRLSGSAATTGSTGPELEITTAVEKKTAPPEPPKRKYTPPKIIEIPDMPAETTKVNTPPPKAPAPPKPTPVPKPTRANKTSNSNPRVNALFAQQVSNELSEKLSLQPLKDLTKGLSINDRLLYTNDLFEKDANVFNAALKRLNEMSNMDEARSFLEEQAVQFQWPDGEKADIAREFIKHVRRRYV